MGAWIGAALVLGAPAVLGVVYLAGEIWRQWYVEGSEEEARRARRVVGLGAVLSAMLLLFVALPHVRTVIAAGVVDPGWHRGRRSALAWLILLAGLAAPYVALAMALVSGRPSARLGGMALVLGWVPVWCVGLFLTIPACWGTPLIVCGGLMGPALAFVLLSPFAWLAVATRVFVRLCPEDARRRASGVRATAAWLTGIVASALVLGAWEPRYRAPTPPPDRRLPVAGVPTASTAWTAKVEHGARNLCHFLPFPPAVDASGVVYVQFWDRVVAVSAEGEVVWKRVDLRAGKPASPRAEGGVYVVTDGILEEGEPRTAGGVRQLVEVLPDGSTGRSWPYVETPLPRWDGGFYSLTRDHLVAVGPDGAEEWRTAIPHDRGPPGRPFYHDGGNIAVPVRGDDRVHVVAPDGEPTRTLSGVDAEPPRSWVPGPYPAPGPAESLVSWDGDLVAVRPGGDTLWRKRGYEPRVATAPDGSLRGLYSTDRGEIFLVRLDSAGPTWQRPLVPADRSWARVSAGPAVGDDGASLLLVVAGRVRRALAVDHDGSLRWISEPLPGVDVEHAVAWGPGGRAYVVQEIQERGRCAAVVALESPHTGL